MKDNKIVLTTKIVPLSDLVTHCPEDDLVRNQKQLPIKTGDYVFYHGELVTCGADYLTEADAKDGITIVHKIYPVEEPVTDIVSIIEDIKEPEPVPTNLKQAMKKIMKFKK